jgi:hypothetical protein
MKRNDVAPITEAEALAFGESGAWMTLTNRERAELQLWARLLCMPFATFHASLEAALDRPVWTHEIADPERLLRELEGLQAAPDLEGIIGQVPADKRVVIGGYWAIFPGVGAWSSYRVLRRRQELR